MTKRFSIAIFHNIMWSKYKGGVFSALYKSSSEAGVDVTFTQIAETEGDRISLGGVDLSYHRYPYTLLFKGSYSAVPTWRRVWALLKAALNAKADVVILPGYDRVEYWVMLGTLVLRRKTRVVFCDSTAFDRPASLPKSFAKRIFFGACNGYFAYGVRSKEYLISHGADAANVYFRRQAAALPHDYSEDAALAARSQSAPRLGDAPTYIYVGRLSGEKGLHTLIDAFKIVLQREPLATLKLIGAGDMKGDLQARINAERLGECVLLAGSMTIAQLANQYAVATAIVLPSTSEPWGLVVNEALSHGCPAIVSHACGCVPELVLDGITGYQFPTGHVAELADRMLLVATQKDGKEWSQACIAHMRDFTPEKTAAQILYGCEQIAVA
jgi:glycosyltransferase involved in cell wall biosynthesis